MAETYETGSFRRPGFRQCLAASLLLLLLSLNWACRDGEDHPRPDQLLRDSLGLGRGDAVYRVEVGGGGGRERVEPSEVRVPPGAYVEFATTDRRVHTVAFLLDSLPPEGARFLQETAQAASPPLLELDSRYVVSLEGAPPGRYPFLVEGNGGPGRGAVVVVAR